MRRHQTAKPMRRCIACRQSRPQAELIRFTLSGDSIAADEGERADGRGFYLCPDRGCAENAVKRKAFNRVCRRNMDTDEITKVIEKALDDRQGGMNVKES